MRKEERRFGLGWSSGVEVLISILSWAGGMDLELRLIG